MELMFCLAAESKFPRLAMLILMLVSAEGSLRAAAPANYFTRTWQVEEGLPQNKVTAVVQTRDGYLWLGTYNGLARFDGVRFTIFDEDSAPAIGSSRITSLYEADNGALWIATENGNVSRYENGNFTAVPLHANWKGGKIYFITSDDARNIWLMNEAGQLARSRDGMVLEPDAGKVPKVLALARGVDGTMWVDREGVVSACRNGELTVAISTNEYVQGICAARDGGLWVACNSRLRKWMDGKWTADLGVAPWGWGILTALAETTSGALAGGTSGAGVWLVNPGQTNLTASHFDRTNGLPSDWVISIREDREKNLWCGTGAGLVVIRTSNLQTISPPDKWRSCPVLSVLPTSDGALWVGTEGAGLYRFKDSDWTNYAAKQGMMNVFVWSLAADELGGIWAGTWGGGIFRQTNDSFSHPPELEEFLAPTPAMLFLNGELWIGTTAGAARYRGGHLQQFNEIDGLPFGDVRVIAPDSSGALWFGTAGSGLVYLKDGVYRRFNKQDGLSSEFIDCLHFAEDGTLWIGTFGGGLNRLKNGKFSVINHEDGLPNSVIGHIEADGHGYLWMSSYGGILRASEKDLNRCADGELAHVPFLTYGINDGLPTLECAEGLQPAGCKTADGRIWFPTAKGLVAVDPAGATVNPRPPPVRIEEMRVDDKPFASSPSAGALKIPPGRHRIEFEYTGLSFVAPEKVRFQCRLENFDSDWVDAGTKRVATYSYIPPGKYLFHVIACNNDGIWNETGAQLAFEVLPYFWQTTSFHVLGGLATVMIASGAVWFETRRRMRRRLERAERQRDIERERTRIAQDIHDDLGAQLTRITMMSESARGEVTQVERTAFRLEKIYDTARDLTRSMDEIVWAVNPRHDTLESLATYLEKFAQDWLVTAGIRCRLDLPLQFPEWHLSSEVRHNVFLAFKEALHNSMKHSNATEIIIRLVLNERSCELTVEDNGQGFTVGEAVKSVPSAGPRVASGNGLENMKRRLAETGGTFEILSRPGEGTKVVFRVPFEA